MSWYDDYPDIFKEVLSKIFLYGFFDKYNKEQYTISSDKISVVIKVMDNSLCIQKIEGSNFFPYLSLEKRKCADAIIIQKVKDNTYTYNLHIFELTGNIKKDEEHLVKQFEGACLRVLAILSYFKNIKLNKALLYFVRGRTKTDPAMLKFEIKKERIADIYCEKEDIEIENNTYTFEQNKLKIKLLKDGDTYNIRNICSEYEININKDISHLI